MYPVGIRVFNFSSLGLFSYAASYRWSPGWQPAATCLHQEEVPREDCGCGYHSCKSFNYLCAKVEYGGLKLHYIYALIEMRGKIVVQEHGYRAQFARVTHIVACQNILAHLLGTRMANDLEREASDFLKVPLISTRESGKILRQSADWFK